LLPVPIVADVEDSGVSDSDTSDEDSEPFFSDNSSVAEYARPNPPSFTPEPPADEKRKELVHQVSVLSWMDFLRSECPVCDELKSENATSSDMCGPCKAPVCRSCVIIFKQPNEDLFVKLCRKCRKTAPEEREVVCPVCRKKHLQLDEVVVCTECERGTCEDCSDEYMLKSLGEVHPRVICDSCCEEVKKQLSKHPSLKEELKKKSPRKLTFSKKEEKKEETSSSSPQLNTSSDNVAVRGRKPSFRRKEKSEPDISRHVPAEVCFLFCLFFSFFVFSSSLPLLQKDQPSLLERSV
jgi:hypothetical protein